MNLASELKQLTTTCGVTPAVMALAVDNMLSERSLQRIVSLEKEPKSPLHRIVLDDILRGLRYAYAMRWLPLKDAALSGTQQQKAAQRKAMTITIVKDAINESRNVLDPGS